MLKLFGTALAGAAIIVYCSVNLRLLRRPKFKATSRSCTDPTLTDAKHCFVAYHLGTQDGQKSKHSGKTRI